jgi:hypothetical protein
MVHVADQQLTYLHTLDKAVGQNTKNIVDLAMILRDSIKNASLQLNRNTADLIDVQETVIKQA